MSLKWRVVDCSTLDGSIRTARGSVDICKADGSVTNLPLADVAVLLLGMEVTVSAAALHRLMQQDVSVLICDWKGVPEGGVYSWSEHGRVGARARAQAALTVPRAKNAWGRIVKAKILGQAAVLQTNGIREHKLLTEFAGAVRSGDTANLEAHAARIYWDAISGPGYFKRTPRLNLDDTNACLNYAYTVLRGFGIQAVLAAGLTPALGVFHRNRANNFALVDDLIEPFRPAVDAGVFALSDKDIAKPEVRAELVAIAQRKFAADGLTVPSVFRDFAQHYALYVEKQIDFINPPVWRREYAE